jgi:hypothetical protein
MTPACDYGEQASETASQHAQRSEERGTFACLKNSLSGCDRPRPETSRALVSGEQRSTGRGPLSYHSRDAIVGGSLLTLYPSLSVSVVSQLARSGRCQIPYGLVDGVSNPH